VTPLGPRVHGKVDPVRSYTCYDAIEERGFPPEPQPAPDDQEEFSSADEVEKELGGGVREALADFKAAIGRAGPAPSLEKQDEWHVALAALSLPLLQSVCVEVGVEAGAILRQTEAVCIEEALAVEVEKRPPPPKSAEEEQQERLLKALERAEAREAAADAREAAAAAQQ